LKEHATNFLEYGITVSKVSVHTGIEIGTGTLTFMASTRERAYNGVGVVPPVGSCRGKASCGWSGWSRSHL